MGRVVPADNLLMVIAWLIATKFKTELMSYWKQ
jgi:hypothetical protein